VIEIIWVTIILGMVSGLLAGLFGIGGGNVFNDHYSDGNGFRLGASSFGVSGVV
jgi:hypothetical protein